MSESEIFDETERLLREAVERRMISDVPLGTFLSGGVDSTTVAALMQSLSGRPVKTFSIGYEEPQYDESSYAKRASFHLGTEHTQFIVSPRDALDVIPGLPMMYDEPFADASQIPTAILCKLAREHVTVALSGDGGDELFGGYVRHQWAERIARGNRYFLGIPGKIAKRTIEAFSPQRWDEIYPKLRLLIRRLPAMRSPGHYAYKFAAVLGTRDPMEMYARLTRLWEPEVLLSSIDPAYRYNGTWGGRWKSTATEAMMMLDLLTYLPDDILVKVDRASMAHSLEVRAPFVDHLLIEHCWRLSLSQKVSYRDPKHILKAIAQKHVPREIFDRPKTGFGIPIDSWLRGPLNEWAEDLLSENSLRSGGIFSGKKVQEKWREHKSGRRNWQYHIWYILMFEAWRRAGTKSINISSTHASQLVLN